MMQPPRQMVASDPRSRLHRYSFDPAARCSKPCAYATILAAYSASRMSSTSDARSDAVTLPRLGPARIDEAVTRSRFWLESIRANTASVIPVRGTPSSSADWLVHRPVPFCSASSSI